MATLQPGRGRPSPRHERRWLLNSGRYALLLVLTACFELSPFETDLEARESDVTAKQLARLAALPEPTGSFSFALVSDTHEHLETLHGLVNVFNARDDLAFVVHLGDMTNTGLRREYRGTLEELDELHVPFITVVGNHDVLSHGRDIYQSMFGPFDYVFSYGGIRFACFNANALEFPGEEVPDLAWLREATLSDPELAGVIVFSHQPLKQPEQLEVLVDNGVLAAFGAHIHLFTMDAKEGVLSVTTGAGNVAEWVLVSVDGTQVTVAECSGPECSTRDVP